MYWEENNRSYSIGIRIMYPFAETYMILHVEISASNSLTHLLILRVNITERIEHCIVWDDVKGTRRVHVDDVNDERRCSALLRSYTAAAFFLLPKAKSKLLQNYKNVCEKKGFFFFFGFSRTFFRLFFCSFVVLMPYHNI